MDGEPVQILKYNNDNQTYELDVEKLKTIFLQPHLKNVNLSVVSIAGAFRKGKSFLLSFCLRYLNSVVANDNDDSKWLNNAKIKLSGFAWRGGIERHTTGIWIWSNIFTKRMPDGKEIGIVLMDTQGTYDHSSSTNNNVTIFALSTMLSSIQIYNLFNHIQENDLQELQFFTEYGRVANENVDDSSGKPFQTLLFLIRDWSFPYEYPYGMEGGAQNLNKILSLNPDQAPENQVVRKHLNLCFDKMLCYLMPSPGESVKLNSKFDGKLADIDPLFIKHLKILIPTLLRPTNIVQNGLKQINGRPITPIDFFNLMQQYWNVFNNQTLPEAKSILTATTEAACLSAIIEATSFYMESMPAYCDMNEVTVDELLDVHQTLLYQTVDMYDTMAKLGDVALRNKYREKLMNSLQDRLLYYLRTIDKRDSNLKAEIMNNEKSEIELLQSQAGPSSNITKLNGQFDMLTLSNGEQQEEQLRNIENTILETAHAQDKLLQAATDATTEAACFTATLQAKSSYLELMQDYYDDKITVDELLEVHTNILDQVIDIYDASVNMCDLRIRNNHREQLKIALQELCLCYTEIIRKR